MSMDCADQHAWAAVLVTCGLPAAGKSRAAALLAQLSPHRLSIGDTPVRVEHISFDSVLAEAVAAEAAGSTASGATQQPEFSPETWQASRALAFERLYQALQAATTCSNPAAATSSDSGAAAAAAAAAGGVDAAAHSPTQAQGAAADPDSPDAGVRRPPAKQQRQRLLVIADDNMQYRSMRHECLQIARRHGAAFLQLYISCDPEVALQRNAGRAGPHRVPEASLLRMHAVLEPPQPSSCAWEAATLQLTCSDADRLTGPELWALVAPLWGPPALAAVPPVDEAALAARRLAGDAANSASAVHAVDARSRRLLAHAVAAAPKGDKVAVASLLNDARRRLLQDCRGTPAGAPASVASLTGTPALQGAPGAPLLQPDATGHSAQLLLQLEAEFEALCRAAVPSPPPGQASV